MNRKILTISIITLAIDQVSKYLIEMFLKLGEKITVIPNFFNLTLVYNEGAAWGIFSNKKAIILFGTLLSAIIIYHFIYTFKTNRRNNLAFGFLIGGLSGNLLDRVMFGYVRDFLDFYIFKYDYPVFNMADVSIVIGVILLIIAVFKGEDRHETNSKRKS